ncbi:hypothetical protein ACA910_018967 [Epithemia clementina (nom. ined.)]
MPLVDVVPPPKSNNSNHDNNGGVLWGDGWLDSLVVTTKHNHNNSDKPPSTAMSQLLELLQAAQQQQQQEEEEEDDGTCDDNNNTTSSSLYSTQTTSNSTAAVDQKTWRIQQKCHAILHQAMAQQEWKVVLATLQYMMTTNGKKLGVVMMVPPIQRSTFTTCLHKATSSSTSTSTASTFSSTTSSNGNQDDDAMMDAALQILQLQVWAGWPPDATDVALVVFALCRRAVVAAVDHSNQGTTGGRGGRDGTGSSPSSGWETAWKFLQQYQTKTPNIPILVYDAILTCLVDLRDWRASIRILQYLQQQQQHQQQTSNMTMGGAVQTSNMTMGGAIIQVPAPAVSTYRLVIECCVKAQQPDAAMQVLQSALSMTRTTKTTTTNEDINKNNHHHHQDGSTGSSSSSSSVVGTPPLSLYSFELIIGLLCEKSRWRQALQLLHLMVDELSIRPTIQIQNAVLMALCRAGELAQAKHLLHRMSRSLFLSAKNNKNNNNNNKNNKKPRQPPTPQLQQQSNKTKTPTTLQPPNVLSYNVLISACANTPGRWKEALQWFDACLRAPGIQPDIYTYTNAIRACAKGRDIRKALSLWQVLQDRSKFLPPRRDAHAYTAMIDACAAAGDWEKALSLLDEMRQPPQDDDDGDDNDNSILVAPTEVTYSAAISACGNARQWKKALELLHQMKNSTNNNGRVLKPNKIIYNNVLTAMARASKSLDSTEPGHHNNISNISNNNNNNNNKDKQDSEYYIWTQAKQLLKEMDDNGIEKDGFTYSAALTCCQGQWKEALNLIDCMRRQQQQQGQQPNKIAYTAAIASCGKAGQAQKALELFRNITTLSSSSSSSSSSLSVVGRRRGGGNGDQVIIPDRVMYNALFSALRNGVVGNDNNSEDGGSSSSSSVAVNLRHHATIVWDLWQQMVQQGRHRSPVMVGELMPRHRHEDEPRSNRSNNSKNNNNHTTFTSSIAAMHIVTPDMITITNAIGALNHDRVDVDVDDTVLHCHNGKTSENTTFTNNNQETIQFMQSIADRIYSDSVDLMGGNSPTALPTLVVLSDDEHHKSEPSADGTDDGEDAMSWEVDLSGLSLPVARAACRYVLVRNILESYKAKQHLKRQPQSRKKMLTKNPVMFRNLIFKTGVGSNKQQQQQQQQQQQGHNDGNHNPTTSLREYIQTILSTDFNPPIESYIPSFAPGTVHISSDMIQYWAQRQQSRP